MPRDRQVPDLPNDFLAFGPRNADRFVNWSTFVGREFGIHASYQVAAVSAVVDDVARAVRAADEQVQTARRLIADARAEPGAQRALRTARSHLPVVGRLGADPVLASAGGGAWRRLAASLAERAAAPDLSAEGQAELLGALREARPALTVTAPGVLPQDGGDDGPVGGTEKGPHIEAVSPASAPPGTVVLLTGRLFNRRLGSDAVSFGQAKAVASHWTDKSAQVVVPDLPAQQVEILIAGRNGEDSNPVMFTVLAPASGTGTTGTGTTGTGTTGTGTTGTGTTGTDADPAATVEAILRSSLGYLFDDRTRISPAGFVLGEHLFSLALAPGEEVVLEERRYTKRNLTLEEELEEERQVEVEEASSYSTELAESLSRENRLQSDLDFSHQHTLGAKFKIEEVDFNASASSSLAASLNQADTVTREDSSKRSYQQSRKVASKMRAAHRIDFRISTDTGVESASRRTIRNPNRGTGLSLQYFKIMSAVRLSHERTGVRLCWAPFVKDPGAAVRRRAAAVALAERERFPVDEGLPPKPEPVIVQTERRVFNSPSVDLNDRFNWPWKDMSTDVDVPIDVTDGFDWDGNDPVVTLSFTGSRPAGAYAVGAPARTLNRYVVRVHAGIDWTLFGARGSASVQVAIGTVDTRNAAAATAMRQYWQDTARWIADAARLRRAALEAGNVAAASATEQVLAQADPLTELLTNVVQSHFPPTVRDDFTEIDLWHRVFDLTDAGYSLYASPWSGADPPLPERSAADFLNASWARLYLPVRPGNERAALRLVLGGRLGPLTVDQEAVITALIEELDAYRTEHYGTPRGGPVTGDDGNAVEHIDTLLTWDDVMPTDGTHVESVLSASSSLDAASSRALTDEEALRQTGVDARNADRALVDRATQLLQSVEGRVVVGPDAAGPDGAVIVTANGRPE